MLACVYAHYVYVSVCLSELHASCPLVSVGRLPQLGQPCRKGRFGFVRSYFELPTPDTIDPGRYIFLRRTSCFVWYGYHVTCYRVTWHRVTCIVYDVMWQRCWRI